MAHRIFLRQNLISTNPEEETAYIINGSSNEMPNAKRNCNTKVIKSTMLRKVTRPEDCPYLYRKSKTYGVTKKYEKRQPQMNKNTAGIVIDLII